MAVEPEAIALLDELGCLLDKLSGVDLTGLAGGELLEFTREWERFKRSGVVVDHGVVAELESRHMAGETGARSTAALLVDLLRLDPGVARRRVADAAEFGARRGLSGEPLEPIRPLTARALAGGAIGSSMPGRSASCSTTSRRRASRTRR